MERDNTQLIALMEGRLQALRSLAQEIKSAQEACVALDLEALRDHDNQKGKLCAEIRRLDLAIGGVVGRLASAESLRAVVAAGQRLEPQSAPTTLRKLEALMEESEAARSEVQRLNRVYAQFLARSRDTLNVMTNVVSHCLGVYPSLVRPGSLTLPFERSY